jgi:hypothetical protein
VWHASHAIPVWRAKLGTASALTGASSDAAAIAKLAMSASQRPERAALRLVAN